MFAQPTVSKYQREQGQWNQLETEYSQTTYCSQSQMKQVSKRNRHSTVNMPCWWHIRESHNVLRLVGVMKQEDDFVHKMIDTWFVMWTTDIQHPLVSWQVICILLVRQQVPYNHQWQTIITISSHHHCTLKFISCVIQRTVKRLVCVCDNLHNQNISYTHLLSVYD